MRISDWSSDVCSSDLGVLHEPGGWYLAARMEDPSSEDLVARRRYERQELALLRVDHVRRDRRALLLGLGVWDAFDVDLAVNANAILHDPNLHSILEVARAAAIFLRLVGLAQPDRKSVV